MSDTISIIKSSSGSVNAQVSPDGALVSMGNVDHSDEVDMDDYVQNGIWYIPNAATVVNGPSGATGGMLISLSPFLPTDTVNKSGMRQIFVDNNNVYYFRSMVAYVWTPWLRLSDPLGAMGYAEASDEGAVDLDDYVQNGIWYISNATAIVNGPYGAIGGMLISMSPFLPTDTVNTSARRQIFIDNNNVAYFRSMVAYVWTPWVSYPSVAQESPMPTPELFSIDFSAVSDDASSMIGYKEEYVSDGVYRPTGGWDDLVTIDKYVVCDDVSYSADVVLESAGVGVVTLGTRSADYSTSHFATVVKFDFDNHRVEFLTSEQGGGNFDGKSLPGYVYASEEMSGLSGTMYRVEIGRKGRCPYAKVTNLSTSSVCAEKTLSEYAEQEGYGGKAGTLYDLPTFSVLSGSVAFSRVACAVPSDPFALFIGDSITQGLRVTYNECWAKMAADYFGNSVTMGRGGGTINHVISALEDVASKVRPKYVVVTIGTNGGNSKAKLDKVVSLIKSMGAVPIVNCVSQLAGGVSYINDDILDLPCMHARFDIATSVSNNLSNGQNESLFDDDLVHPNADGHKAMYDAFVAEAGWVKVR